MTAKLLVVRHGQSTWNADGRWQGTEDPPLSDLGVHQARLAADAVGLFDVVAASNLERAAHTATVIADELGIGPVVIEPDLAERYAGAFQGLTKIEIEERFPGYLAERRRPDDFEPDSSVTPRAVGAMARIAVAAGDEGTALVVTHSGVIHALERLIGAHRDGRIPNLGGRWFDVGPGTLTAGDDIVLIDEEAVTIPDQI